MPSGVYKRKPFTPEHCAAISKAKKGVPYTPEHCAILSKVHTGVSLSPEHCAAISKGKTGVPLSPEHCVSLSKAKKGAQFSSEHCAALSEASRNSDAVKARIDSQKGGDDIVEHHYIYDHSNLSKYTMKMTRSNHAKLHWLMRKSNIKVPHINTTEENKDIVKGGNK